MPASRAQVRIALSVALALFLVFTAMLFFGRVRLPAYDIVIPITSVVLVMAAWITATLLFAQARVLQARPLRALALGFFFTGLLVAFRVLAIPGYRMAEAHYNLPLWFYLASHAALPLAILSYAWPGLAANEPAPFALPGHRLTDRQMIASVVVAWGIVLVAMVSETVLAWTSPIFLTAIAVLLPTIGAMVLLWRRLASVLDLWLLLMLWGWLLETILIALPSPGFTAGWYAARGLGLVSGLFVLFALLAETSKLYAQTVLQLIAQAQEREHRFLIRDVMSASIAHELRQPLAAIMINAEVARKIASDPEQPAPADEIVPVLDDIIASSLRANDMLESTRAMFGRGDSDRDLVDPAVILESTLAMVEGSARAHGVSVKFVMEDRPGAVLINRLQFQQALLNLFQNAIEALSHSEASDRTLLVRCACWEDRGVIIRVEDNGPGIAPADRKQIFDAFFTTRPEGLGMGLVIARSVIRAHGGRLEVEPRSPAGAAFVRAHGGRLEVEPRSPAGTVFTIHLPYGAQRPDVSAPRRATASA